jgi:hypothetical protein
MDLKLGRLPERTPVKLSISISPSLHEALAAYAALYAEAYGKSENVVDLVPFMLQAFLEGDRAFAKHLAKSARAGDAK